MKDLHSNIKTAIAITPAAYKEATDPTPVVVDRAGYESVVLVAVTGTVTDAQTLVVEHSDDNSTGFEAITQADVNGTLADFLAVAAAEDDTTRKLGYIGGKRYLRVTCDAAGATGAIFGVVALLGHPVNGPVA